MRSGALLAAALLVSVQTSRSLFAEPKLAEGVRIEAAGQAIDVDTGHAVPVVTDWDEDGNKDLIVGQFGGGKIRFYRNVGTDAAPSFDGFEFIKAGGKDISVPCG